MITQPAVLDSLSTPAPTRGANSGRLSIFAVLLFLLVFVAVYVMLHLVSFTQSFPHWATAVLEGSEGKTLLAALLDLDQPLADPSYVMVHALSKLTRQHVTVAI
ncbi:MAG: hypothetical protein HQL64_15860, partial [Magnetococcales bacterium]|nr:hypothetical protein [Magnetococcales bacterium]